VTVFHARNLCLAIGDSIGKIHTGEMFWKECGGVQGKKKSTIKIMGEGKT